MSPVKKTKRLRPSRNVDTSLDVLFKEVFWEMLSELLPVVFGQSVGALERITQEVVFPEKRYPDLLAWVELSDGSRQLVHVEIQSSADGRMNRRMLVYAAFLYHRFERLPIQLVLYVGEADWPLEPVVAGDHPLVQTVHRYSLVQLRALDSEVFLGTDRLGGLLLAALGRSADPRGLALRILERAKKLAQNEPEFRDFVTRKLITAITLRPRWSEVFYDLIRKDMPILLEDVRKSKVIQHYINEGLEQGKLETAKRLLRKGRPLELVEEATELDRQTLLRLAEEVGEEEPKP